METDACEPPSHEFVRAMRRENVYKKFIDRLENEDSWKVEYNDWDDDDEDELESSSQQQDKEEEEEIEYSISNTAACLMLKQIQQMKEKFTQYCS